MTGHQFLKVKLNVHTYRLVGTVDYPDKVKRRFYVEKMVGQLKKMDLMVKTRIAPATAHNHEYVEILAKHRPVERFVAIAWVHPRGGGDDYRVQMKITADDLTGAKKAVKEELVKKFHSQITNDFTIKKVKKFGKNAKGWVEK
jgi:hypothetical protein